MKKLNLILVLLLLFVSSGLWSQTSWEPVSDMTTAQLWLESSSLSLSLVNISDQSFQTFLLLRKESQGLRNQLTNYDLYLTELESQSALLRKQVSEAETKAQKAESSQTASIELTENLQNDIKRIKRNNTLILIGGGTLVTALLVALGFALAGG